MREIDAEEDKNDWVRAVVDVPGVGDGVVDRLAELNLPVMPQGTDRQRAGRQRSSGGLLDIARAVRTGEIDIDPDDDKLAAQLGSIK
jgi:hypothetical protein